MPNGLYSSVLRVERQDRIRRRNLAAVIQMGVNVGSCPNIAVPQPFLDFLQADAICVKQAGAAVTKVVETDFFQAVIFQRDFKMLGDKIGLHKLAHRIDIDVIKVLLAIGCSAHLLIDQLLLSEPVQQFLKGWDQRQRAIAGFRLGPVFLDRDFLAVHRDLCNRVLDCKRLFLKVDGVPFQPNNLAAAQAIKCGENNSQFNRIAAHHMEKSFKLLLIVDSSDVFGLSGPFHAVGRIGLNQADLESILQAFANVRVTMDDCIRGQPCVQFLLIVFLNVLRVLFQVLKRELFVLEIRGMMLLLMDVQ